MPSELVAAFLWAQFEEAERITRIRLDLWNRYHESFESLEQRGLLRRPIIPQGCSHNAHMYYVLLAPSADREEVLARLTSEGIGAVFHYVPLHDSPAGRRYGRTNGNLTVTNDVASRLIPSADVGWTSGGRSEPRCRGAHAHPDVARMKISSAKDTMKPLKGLDEQ